jgi:hypothetical protein
MMMLQALSGILALTQPTQLGHGEFADSGVQLPAPLHSILACPTFAISFHFFL